MRRGEDTLSLQANRLRSTRYLGALASQFESDHRHCRFACL